DARDFSSALSASERAEALDEARERGARAIDALGVDALADGEADRARRALLGEAHRLQHGARLGRADRAGAPGRDRDALEVEVDEQRLALAALRLHAHDAGEAALLRAE